MPALPRLPCAGRSHPEIVCPGNADGRRNWGMIDRMAPPCPPQAATALLTDNHFRKEPDMLDRRWIAAALALALTLAAPMAARAADSFGAIAYSPATGQIGWVKNDAEKADAEKTAMDHCAEKGATDCALANTVKNSCAAIATGDNGWGSNWDDTVAAAESKTLATCGQYTVNCKIAISFCSE
jgi:hypothetical protein